MTPYILGQSKALYGTWFYLPTYNLLLDCGDGTSFGLGTHVQDIKYIFISHFHFDHYLGLLSVAAFLGRVTKKTRKKTKLFFHENNSKEIENIKTSLKILGLNDVFEYISFNFKDKIEIQGKKFVEIFEVNHTAKYYKNGIKACGFKIYEERKKLKIKYLKELEKLESNKEKSEYVKKITEKIESPQLLYDYYKYVFVTYCGDSLPVDFNIIGDTEILMHECTFLTKEEADAAHTDLENLIENIKKAENIKIEKFILYHISEKYIRENKKYPEIIKEKFSKLNKNVDVVEINKVYKCFK